MHTVRSILFNIVFFGWHIVLCLAYSGLFLLPRNRIWAAIRFYAHSVQFLERTILGIRWEHRGDPFPQGACIVAMKHQSAWETLKIPLWFRDGSIVLKRELTWIPIWGWFLRKMDFIPIDRGARGKAIQSLVRGGQRAKAQDRPIVIFPQGTRIAPGVWRPYRYGIAALYAELNLPVVPVALNSGLFWPRRAFRKRAGTIVVEVLPPIPPGLPPAEMMAELERRLEAASDRIVLAAGGPPTLRPNEVGAATGPAGSGGADVPAASSVGKSIDRSASGA